MSELHVRTLYALFTSEQNEQKENNLEHNLIGVSPLSNGLFSSEVLLTGNIFLSCATAPQSHPSWF